MTIPSTATPLFKKAYALPQAQYHTPQQARLDESEVMLTGMNAVGKTNATSTIPVIGTTGFNPCIALILYNKRTKTAAVAHEFSFSPKLFDELLQHVRTKDDQHINIHIIGGPVYTKDQEAFSAADTNKSIMQELENLLRFVEQTPNTTLSSFDAYDKPKPNSVAFDTRNGRFISGSALCRSFEEAEQDIRYSEDRLARFEFTEEDFDGTLAELQKKQKLKR